MIIREAKRFGGCGAVGSHSKHNESCDTNMETLINWVATAKGDAFYN
jgi:hypothetical protein